MEDGSRERQEWKQRNSKELQQQSRKTLEAGWGREQLIYLVGRLWNLLMRCTWWVADRGIKIAFPAVDIQESNRCVPGTSEHPDIGANAAGETGRFLFA